MSKTPTVDDLALAIKELDSMYEDLQQNASSNAPLNIGSISQPSSPADDRHLDVNTNEDDYDIPRPAVGVFNTPSKGSPPHNAARHQAIVKTTPTSTRDYDYSDDADYSVPVGSHGNSTQISITSDYSSGLGISQTSRLSGEEESVVLQVPEASKSAVSQHSDSDYDEVASGSDEDDNNLKMAEERTSVKNSNASPSDGDRSLPNGLNMPGGQNHIKEDPDYDDVYSASNSRQSSVCNKLPGKSNQQSGLNGVTDDVTQRPISENRNANGNEEFSSADESDSGSAKLPSKDQARNSSSPEKSTMKDVEAQNKKKGTCECPCECRYAVPLMTAAIVLCIALLMMAVIGYFYFGLHVLGSPQNSSGDEFVETTIGAEVTTTSGDGN